MPGASLVRKIIGVIGCQVLEDEVVHVLAQDEELEHILVIDSPKVKGIASKLLNAGKRDVVEVSVEELATWDPQNGTSAVVWIKPIELHQSPSNLREDVLTSAKLLASFSDSLIFFYGICGNAFRGIDMITNEFNVPVVILRDANGLVVDDCVGAVLGGAEEYRDFLLRDKGGYTMNTMWAANWRDFMVETQFLHSPIDPEEARMVFYCMDYKRVVMLVTGLGDDSLFHRQAEEFASIFGLESCEERCRLDVVETSYRLAKGRMKA